VVSVDGGETVWIHWDTVGFPYLATVRWAAEDLLTLVVQDRRQHSLALLGANPRTGESWEIHSERDEAWLNLDQQMPRWLDDGQRFLWTTERNGAWALELRSREGELERVLVEPGFAYSDLIHIDEEADELWFRAQPEPTESQVFRTGLLTETAVELVTSESGWHYASVSDDGSWLHTASLSDGTNVRDVVRRDGVRIPMDSHSVPVPFETNLEIRTVGELEFRASIVRPSDFDRSAQYPVIVSVYGGPMSQSVRQSPGSFVYQQWFANQGFIVVSFDGRGTPHRGRDWERASDGRFVEIALEDQSAALEALLLEIPEMDASRVGVMGWSFGGTMAAVMTMRRPDLYQCGISGAPVTDWRDYDTHYTERYLGLPDENPEAYEANNVIAFAAELARPLMLIHGAMDDNVYFSHSAQLFDALLRSGAEVDFVPLFGATHMVADRELSGALQARYLRFFMEHLSAR
jgi:dipeptidyl-peptidase-4